MINENFAYVLKETDFTLTRINKLELVVVTEILKARCVSVLLLWSAAWASLRFLPVPVRNKCAIQVTA